MRPDGPGSRLQPSEPRPGAGSVLSAASSERSRQRARFALTGLGGMVTVFGACFLGLLIADWARWAELASAVFFMAASLTVYYVRPASLLPVVVSAPLLFLAACVLEQLIAAPGTLAALEGTAVTLASAAWWMLAGMTLTVTIALLRGLRLQLRALRADLRTRA